MRLCKFCGCRREPRTAPDPYTTDGTVEVCPKCNNAESYVSVIDMWPKTLVFRQYDDDTGLPLENGYVIEREAPDEETAQSLIKEFGLILYELESAVPTEMLDKEDF